MKLHGRNILILTTLGLIGFCSAYYFFPEDEAKSSRPEQETLRRAAADPESPIAKQLADANSALDRILLLEGGLYEDLQTSSVTPSGVTDKEWLAIPKKKVGMNGTFRLVSSDPKMLFRSSVLNPNDVYIPPSMRKRFLDDCRSGAAELEWLEQSKNAMLVSEARMLRETNALVKVQHANGSTTWRPHKHKKAKKIGKGWHVLVEADGTRTELVLADLPNTHKMRDMYRFASNHLNVRAVEFFYRAGALSRAKRDTLLTNWLNGGLEDLKRLAKTNPEQYKNTLRRLFK